MDYGTGSGWNKLIEKVLAEIEEYNEGKEGDDKIIVTQIKEKFGGLRIYVNFCTLGIGDIIDEVEDESYKVCEKCGSTVGVTTNQDGWMKTRCEDCRIIEAVNKK
jgi:predicted  nucleic acid-binding Zn ribbon protein